MSGPSMGVDLEAVAANRVWARPGTAGAGAEIKTDRGSQSPSWESSSEGDREEGDRSPDAGRRQRRAAAAAVALLMSPTKDPAAREEVRLSGQFSSVLLPLDVSYSVLSLYGGLYGGIRERRL